LQQQTTSIVIIFITHFYLIYKIYCTITISICQNILILHQYFDNSLKLQINSFYDEKKMFASIKKLIGTTTSVIKIIIMNNFQYIQFAVQKVLKYFNIKC